MKITEEQKSCRFLTRIGIAACSAMAAPLRSLRPTMFPQRVRARVAGETEKLAIFFPATPAVCRRAAS